MRVQIVRIRTSEKASDQRVGVRTVDDIGVDHHAGGVEGADRKDAPRHRRRHGVIVGRGFGGAFAHEDWALLAIGRLGGLVFVGEQQHRCADWRIIEAEAAGCAVGGFDADARDAVCGQGVVVKAEKMGEEGGIEAGDAVGHGLGLALRARTYSPLSDMTAEVLLPLWEKVDRPKAETDEG